MGTILASGAEREPSCLPASPHNARGENINDNGRADGAGPSWHIGDV